MLTKLSISNYALIDKLSVDFHAGLNSVTGETGAGKSIVLGALGLILGNRADLSVLKEKDKKCIVEGFFEVKNYGLRPFFEENDLDYESTAILRREILPSGKSRAFVNDTPVNLKILRELGLALIDIHSQHQNLELGNQKFQLNLIDTVSNSGKVLNEYRKLYSDYRNLQKQLADLKQKSEKANADLDYFQFQFDQLNEANLREGEQQKLETELEKLAHAEEIKNAFVQVQELLDNENFSALQNIKESRKALETIRQFMPEAQVLSDRMQSCWLELKDIFDEASGLEQQIEHDPVRMGQINERLTVLFSLQQKHRVSTDTELLELREQFASKISQVVGFGEEIETMEKELAICNADLRSKSNELTELRKSIFPKIEHSIVADLQQLGMAKSKFEIQHVSLPDYSVNGKDSVSLLFSANLDAAPAEISKIASGGEMSRLMLAIKNLLRNSKSLPTVIFDEIDSGVSGEIAIKMGNIIKSFSANTQIINITHLPQIAAKGDAHLQVFKFEKDGKTFTSIKHLNEQERLEELAKMVSGEKLTDSSLKTAQEFLEG